MSSAGSHATANYINDLSDAYDDCNSKLGKVRGLLTEH